MIQYILVDDSGAEIATTTMSPRPMLRDAVKEWLGEVLGSHPNVIGWDEDLIIDLCTDTVLGRIKWRMLPSHPPMSTHERAAKML